jgi:hypothetical protein
MSGSKLPHSKALKCAPSGERLQKIGFDFLKRDSR